MIKQLLTELGYCKIALGSCGSYSNSNRSGLGNFAACDCRRISGLRRKYICDRRLARAFVDISEQLPFIQLIHTILSAWTSALQCLEQEYGSFACGCDAGLKVVEADTRTCKGKILYQTVKIALNYFPNSFKIQLIRCRVAPAV